MAAVRATTRACWPVRVTWSRQASRLGVQPVPTPAPDQPSPGRGARPARASRPGAGLVRARCASPGLSDGGSVLIVVQQPIERLLAIANGVSGGAVADVAADQVVHVIPAVDRLSQQALAVQDVQVPGSLPQAGACQGGGGVAVDGGTRMQAEARKNFCWSGSRCR